MVMTLALLIYSVAQRRMRRQLESTGETVPNQINQPTSRPTLRWVFQMLEGINRVLVSVGEQVTCIMDGITDLRMKILQLFGQVEILRLLRFARNDRLPLSFVIASEAKQSLPRTQVFPGNSIVPTVSSRLFG